MKRYNVILLIITILMLTGCAATVSEPGAAFVGQPPQQIFQGGEQAFADEKYSKAIKYFEGLNALYPFSCYSERADLDLIYAYYQNDDIPSAEAAADHFIRLYPRSYYVDYAYYMKGRADFEQDRGWFTRYFPTDLSQRDPGAARQSFNDFGTLIRLFPDSPYAPDARQHMIYLRNILAAYELNVANYYFRRAAYVAAINRANYILKHYDGTPAVQYALCLQVRAYRELGLPELAQQPLAVLRLNYPNCPTP